MFFKKEGMSISTRALIAITAITTLNISTTNSMERKAILSSDDIEEVFWKIITPEHSYNILSNKYPIPATDWTNQLAVNKRRNQLREELQEDLNNNKLLPVTKFDEMYSKENIIVNGTLAFEKLYAKYAATNGIKISLPEQEYRDVFTVINLARGIDCEWHKGYKWFDRLTTHRMFIISNAIDDKNIIKNMELLNLCLDIICDDSIGYRYKMDNIEFLVWDWFGDKYEEIPVSNDFKNITVGKLLFHLLQNYDAQLPSIHNKFPEYDWQKKRTQ